MKPCTGRMFCLALVGAGMGIMSGVPGALAAPPAPATHWTFEDPRGGQVTDAAGTHVARPEGPLRHAPGVEGQSLVFDGVSTLMTVPPAPAFSIGEGAFAIAAWVNLYETDQGQQVIAAKNDYASNRREWGLMLDRDGRFRFYVRAGGWKTVGGRTAPAPGRWYHVAATAEGGRGRLYVNGELEGEGPLAPAVPATEAPLTLGGVRSGGGLTQLLHGALDEVAIYRTALRPETIASLADKRPEPHHVEILSPVELWSGGHLPKAGDAPVIKDTEFRAIKPYEFHRDGYRFLHGVALAWHKAKLYASFGHNKGGENTDTEEARVRVSDDGGKTWGPVGTIDPGDEPGVGVSHGVFLSHGGHLWAFHGAYSGIMQGLHARAYVLDEADGTWRRKGTVVAGGFWPLQEPLKMSDGNWIMAGVRVGDGNPAAVAISRGDDFTKWDLVVIPKPANLPMWGESSVFVDGKRVVNIARCNSRRPVALVAFSEDHGRTWSASRPSNLPMAASKPYCGTLSTGEHYLIGSTTADGGNRRAPLTIALTRHGETTFSRIFVIRHALFPEGPGESHERASLAYPYAIEREGRLYVGYSNNGGNVGRVGEGRDLWNNNSAEMAVIPVASLAGTP